MDSTQQADGQKRVKALLIKPLEKLGLARPTGLTKEKYGEMIEDLCSRLAYMTDVNLGALGEQAANYPGGKSKDRFPIANHILKWAAEIQPPSDDASPLIRAVFSNPLGRGALRDGWAPELLFDLRKTRRWPIPFAAGRIKESADAAVRRMRNLDEKLARGGEITQPENEWRLRRKAVWDRCQRISELGEQGEAV